MLQTAEELREAQVDAIREELEEMYDERYQEELSERLDDLGKELYDDVWAEKQAEFDLIVQDEVNELVEERRFDIEVELRERFNADMGDELSARITDLERRGE